MRTKMMQDKMMEYIEIEKNKHPWADEGILKRIVMDNLKEDPTCYDSEEKAEYDEEDEEGLSITISKGEDPFPKDEYGY